MKIDWKSSLTACVSVFLLYLAIHYWPTIASYAGVLVGAASSLLIGAVIAYVVNLLMRWF